MRRHEMNNNDAFLGIVQLGQFHILTPDHAAGASVRLTSIPMQAAQPPESGELHLTGYEGQAMMVRGHDGGGWIYSAEVIDQAGPILTAVVRRVFGQQAGKEE
jgi:hypothetical protein